MQIVIDIPSEYCTDNIVNELDCLLTDYFGGTICKTTPLPKGHRRLIAEPTEEEIKETIGGLNDFAEYGRDCVKAVLDNAPTIVEADKEKRDADSD